MENPISPEPHLPQKKPDKGQEMQTAQPDTEVDPGKTGNETEVDLDKSKTKTFPDRKEQD